MRGGKSVCAVKGSDPKLWPAQLCSWPRPPAMTLMNHLTGEGGASQHLCSVSVRNSEESAVRRSECRKI